MNIALNLLPDTRQIKQRNRRRRQTVGAISVLVWIVCGAALLLLGLSLASEKLIIGKLTSDISQKKAKLETDNPELIEALTAQQGLVSLGTLYQQRIYVSKFFVAYTTANPVGVSLSSLTLGSDQTLSVQGNSPSYVAVAKLAKAMAEVKDSKGTRSFSGISIQSASRSDGKVNFAISAVIDQGVTNGN